MKKFILFALLMALASIANAQEDSSRLVYLQGRDGAVDRAFVQVAGLDLVSDREGIVRIPSSVQFPVTMTVIANGYRAPRIANVTTNGQVVRMWKLGYGVEESDVTALVNTDASVGPSAGMIHRVLRVAQPVLYDPTPEIRANPDAVVAIREQAAKLMSIIVRTQPWFWVRVREVGEPIPPNVLLVPISMSSAMLALGSTYVSMDANGVITSASIVFRYLVGFPDPWWGITDRGVVGHEMGHIFGFEHPLLKRQPDAKHDNLMAVGSENRAGDYSEFEEQSLEEMYYGQVSTLYVHTDPPLQVLSSSVSREVVFACGGR